MDKINIWPLILQHDKAYWKSQHTTSQWWRHCMLSCEKKKRFSVQSRFEGSNCHAPCDMFSSVLGQRKSCSKRRWCSDGQWSSICKWLFCGRHCVACFTRARSSISFNPDELKIFPWSEYTHPKWYPMSDFIQQHMGFIQFLPIDFVTSDSGLECPVLCLLILVIPNFFNSCLVHDCLI